MVGGENDWVIEGSEEEDQLGSSELNGHRSTPPLVPEGATSSIKTFTSIPAEKTSHISSVGADLSERSTISSFPPPPPVHFSTISESSSRGSRPRPRPIFSRTSADPALISSISDPIFPHVPSSDHGNPSAIVPHSDPAVVKGPIQGVDDFSPDISERAKMRTRKATKRSSQYVEDVIDITDDDLAMTPTRKPRGRLKSRPVRLATPIGNNTRLNSDPVTVPVLSSSPLLPPSDPFPASTVINSTPPRPGPLDEVAAPDSPHQESPIRSRKRKSTSRPRSPKAGKYRKKAIVEVVITSPRKTKNAKGKALEGKDFGSRNDHPASSPISIELRLGPVGDEDVHVSPRLRSGSDDELILAPKRQPSSKLKPVKSRKGKQKTSTPRSADNNDPSSEREAGEEEREEPRGAEHHAEGASTRSNEDHKSRSCPAGPGSPTPLLEKSNPNVSAQEDDPPKPSVSEIPAPGKLRSSLSQFDRKTPVKTPMRELIRRAASHPSAPFSAASSPIASPLSKTSKSMLRRIAPLHPTRRSPPPPPPRPPPPKKSKKMLDLEEKWELELEDEVEGWWALTDEERRDWRRAKRDKELGYDD